MALRAASLIYPMFVMVLLTGFVLVTLFRSRVRAVREGQLPASFFRTNQGGIEPEYAIKPARHFANLFEAPTLFYVACLGAMATNTAGLVMQLLAWCYVATRIVHAYIHLGANRLRFRIRAYFASWIVLFAMWVYLTAVVATRVTGAAG